MKLCKACGQEKPETEFYKNRSTKSGLNVYCIPCHKARQNAFQGRPRRVDLTTPPGLRYCATCKQTKPNAEFWADRRRYGGLSNRCKECQDARHRAWSAKNLAHLAAGRRRRYAADPKRFKDYERKQNYGLQPGEYDQMLAEQNGRCAICGTDKPTGGNGHAFAVDHCHDAGKVRGLLCSNCNNGLGRFKDDISLLAKAIEYLTRTLQSHLR